jgi:hypothetical protein
VSSLGSEDGRRQAEAISQSHSHRPDARNVSALCVPLLFLLLLLFSLVPLLNTPPLVRVGTCHRLASSVRWVRWFFVCQVYDLFAVVMHSGGPHAGHYHAYIRDMMGEGNWVPAGDIVQPTAPKSSGCVPAIGLAVASRLTNEEPLPPPPSTHMALHFFSFGCGASCFTAWCPRC